VSPGRRPRHLLAVRTLRLRAIPNAHLYRSSDGPQPHFITVEFPRKMAIQVRASSRFPDVLVLTMYRTNRRSAFISISPKTTRIPRRHLQYAPEQGPVICKMSASSLWTNPTAGLLSTSLQSLMKTEMDCAYFVVSLASLDS
jgi:hypothetical protein